MSEELDPTAELLAEIERQWAEADRARGRVIRQATGPFRGVSRVGDVGGDAGGDPAGRGA